MITIPAVLTNPGERAEYLVKHYWDNFDFGDTAAVHLPAITEQAFVDYVDVMPYAPLDVVAASIKEMLRRAEAEKTVFRYFAGLCEKYLYNPNSPMRNDEYFIPALEAMLASPAVDEKTRPASLLALALRNRPGEKATDFTYATAGGETSTLHSFEAEYTLLFFYNPDCHNCREVGAQLQASPPVQSLLKAKRLRILAVYPDRDLTAWRTHLRQFPEEWVNAYDASARLREEEIYDLKAIPMIYLLDKDKVTLLKDPSLEQLEGYLQKLS
jgi:hypothetical protein